MDMVLVEAQWPWEEQEQRPRATWIGFLDTKYEEFIGSQTSHLKPELHHLAVLCSIKR
jgi:hypothetical protein